PLAAPSLPRDQHHPSVAVSGLRERTPKVVEHVVSLEQADLLERWSYSHRLDRCAFVAAWQARKSVLAVLEPREAARFGPPLPPALHIELAQDRRDMVIDCARRKEEALGDRRVPKAIGEQAENV